MWILIIAVIAWDYHGGSAITSIQFADKQACLTAQASVNKYYSGESPYIKTICTPYSQKP